MKYWNIFQRDRKAIIGMVHVQALPGTPAHKYSIKEIINMAVEEAKLYQGAGLDGIIIENMHDTPYINNKASAEITSCLTAVACAIRKSVDLPIGIQILAASNQAALAVALAADLQFIRAEGFVFGHVADEGYIDACAGELLRYRKYLAAEHIAILTDIKKKHSSHAITADIDIAETASAAEFFRSDGLIITGSATGKAVNPKDLTDVRKVSSLPLIIGSGITAQNIKSYWELADGFIIGSYFKKEALWENPLCPQRISMLLQEIR